jgi:Mg-chelatase subunit ChlD
MAAPGKNRFFAAAVIAAAVAAACGSNPDLLPGGSKGDGGSSGGSSSSGGSGGDDGSAPGTFGGDAAFSPDAFAQCASSTQQAKELPLDLYLMLDSSGSMADLVANQKSKWNAVVSALTAFLNDPASAGIGVGLQYFPLTQAGVPTSCTASSQCGAAGPCFLSACGVTTPVSPTQTEIQLIDPITLCDTNANCPRPSTCLAVGLCEYDHNAVCLGPGSAQCQPDNNGFLLGACQAITTSTCEQGDSCNSPDYAMPAVPIALLPGAAPALTASLAAHAPNGNTPTAAALQGAIIEANAFAVANPGHSVVAVLATDGIPDECNPNDIPTIARIAAAGLAGSPSIKTFTIGVFAPGDVATGTAALNQIASSGGTKQAFVINTMSQNVETQFVAALSAIRGAALPCQYEVPLPDGGNADFGKINVQYTSGAGVAGGLPYVETAAKCGTGGGWYYDADPAHGGTPSAVIVCPSTCTTLQSDAMGRVDVVVGCQTVTR